MHKTTTINENTKDAVLVVGVTDAKLFKQRIFKRRKYKCSLSCFPLLCNMLLHSVGRGFALK